MIIDCHGHYTTAPAGLQAFRAAQLAGSDALPSPLDIAVTDDEIRESLENAQLRLSRARGTDLTIFSPRASAMGHHLGTAFAAVAWARACNDLIARVCALYPRNFVGVAQLPQVPGGDLVASIAEMRRCVNELGFVGVNLNPDPSGGHWTSLPLTDRFWHPLYEAMCDLDVPAMVHVSASCNANFHATGAHYLNADTTAFMQFVQGDLFREFPQLRFVIPHGGGAVPYHWGRFRGLAQDLGRPTLEEGVLGNVYFDTCVYHRPGIALLLEVVPHENVLFGSEMVGAVRGIDPRTGHHYDDTKRYVDALNLDDASRAKIYCDNALRVYPRIALRSAALEAGRLTP